MDTPTVEEFAKTFLELHVMPENKPSQQKAVKEMLRNWIFPILGEKRLNELTSLDIVRLRATMLGKKLAPASVNLRLKLLSKMLKCAEAWGFAPNHVEFKFMKQTETDAEFFSENQLSKILAVPAGQPWNAMIRFALQTGLRIGELRALTWDAIETAEKRVRVRQATWSHTSQIVTPKSRKPRTVSLNGEALRALAALNCGEGFVFSHGNGALLGYTNCRNALRRIFDAAGVQGNYGWHTFRHTFASYIAMSGESLRTLQKLMGHANIQTTMRYAHLSPDAGHKAVDVLSRFK